MPKNPEVVGLKAMFESSIAYQDGSALAYCRWKIESLLADDTQPKSTKAHLRAMKRQVKELEVIALNEFRRAMIDLENHFNKATQMLAQKTMNQQRVQNFEQLLREIHHRLMHLYEDKWRWCLNVIITDDKKAVRWLPGKLDVLAGLQRELEQHKKRLKDIVLQDSSAQNRKSKRQSNQERAARQPKGKGKRGKRHLSTHPFRPEGQAQLKK